MNRNKWILVWVLGLAIISFTGCGGGGGGGQASKATVKAFVYQEIDAVKVPVAGAVVNLILSINGSVAASGVTGADGIAVFNDVYPGNSYYAQYDSYISTDQKVTLSGYAFEVDATAPPPPPTDQ